ncbi:hypothetical protein L1987_46385 [Smallanthus sonchifolius]|uniref:Uncharacterized protein n=1 Tax=Smallanthus sonchifolius TaxID=185202 RepID=A0ACB9FZM5_9ASTR|nr:hypothetical protein L1987_46385 [Smallanthus sonchifolius]
MRGFPFLCAAEVSFCLCRHRCLLKSSPPPPPPQPPPLMPTPLPLHRTDVEGRGQVKSKVGVSVFKILLHVTRPNIDEEEWLAANNGISVKCVIIDMTAVTGIDTSGLAMVKELKKMLEKRSLHTYHHHGKLSHGQDNKKNSIMKITRTGRQNITHAIYNPIQCILWNTMCAPWTSRSRKMKHYISKINLCNYGYAVYSAV